MKDLDAIGKQIVDAAFQVHTQMGPGLLESVYQSCMQKELSIREIPFDSQYSVPLTYKNEPLGCNLILDLLVEKSIIVELKAVEQILPVHSAQILSYLKLTKCRLGYLINFHVPLIKTGIKRFVL
jgi:GxxExxY protein